MDTKFLRRLFAVSAFGILAGVQCIPVSASSGSLSISQSVDKISGKSQDQEYVFDFVSDGKTSYSDGTKLKIHIAKGYTPSSFSVGDWSNYEGSLKYTVYGINDNDVLAEADVSENDVIDLSGYTNISGIDVMAEESVSENTNISDTSISGTLNAEETGRSYKINAAYLKADGNGGYEPISEAEKETDCSYYQFSKPVLTANPTTAGQLDAVNAVLSGISGEGNLGIQSFTIKMNIPSRMITDRIYLPQFENASMTLYVDGTERKINEDDSYNVNSKVTSIEVAVSVNGELKQTRDMTVEMRNTSAIAGDEKISASISGRLEDNTSVTAVPDSASFHCNGSTVVPDPDPDPDPDPEPDPGTDPIVKPDPKPSNPSTKPSTVIPGNKTDSTKDNNTQSGKTETNKIVDFSGLNLVSTKADGTEPIMASVMQSDSLRTDALRASTGDRVQSTKVYDFTDKGSATDSETEEFSATATIDDKDNKPADSIKKSSKEKAEEKVKNTLSTNHFLQIMLLILAILLIMGAVIYFIFRENGKDRCEEVSEPIVNDGLPNEYKNLSDAEILKDEGEIETEPDKKNQESDTGPSKES